MRRITIDVFFSCKNDEEDVLCKEIRAHCIARRQQDGRELPQCYVTYYRRWHTMETPDILFGYQSITRLTLVILGVAFTF